MPVMNVFYRCFLCCSDNLQSARTRLYLLLLLTTGVAGGIPVIHADGIALDCDYSGTYYIYAPATTILVKPNTQVGEPIGSWINVNSPDTWQCHITSSYQNDTVYTSIGAYSPYAEVMTTDVDGETYNVFSSAVKAGLGYVARFRVNAGAGLGSTDWTQMTGTATANAVIARPLLGPVPYNGGSAFPLGMEMQIHFVKTSTELSSGAVAAFDPAYVRSYRTYNNGANMMLAGRYRIVDYRYHDLNIRLMAQTCTTPDVSVNLRDVRIPELTGPGTIKGLTPFNLNFNNCPDGLSGINYKFGTTTSILDVANGVVALDAGSDARGVGVVLRSASDAPVLLNTEYSLSDYDNSATRNYTVPLQAGIYQTESEVHSGSVKGSFTFTLIYK